MMRAVLRFVPVILCFSFALSARAQEPAAPIVVPIPDQLPRGTGTPVKPPASPRGRITGTVICGDTRLPARGATVMLAPLPVSQNAKQAAGGRQLTAHVGLNGTFEMEHVPPGQYGVMGFLQGYLSVLDRLDTEAVGNMLGGGDAEAQGTALRKAMEGQPIAIVDANSTATVEIVLERGAAIGGRVLYADGSPAGAVSLVTEDAGPVKKKTKNVEAGMDPVMLMKSLLSHQSFSTDDEGHFRLSGLKPGKYRVAASAPLDLSEGGDEFGFSMIFSGLADPKLVRFYAGDTYHRKSAKVFELNAGDEVAGVDIRLPIDGFHAVRGILTATDGRPINMGELSLTDTADDALVYYARPDLDGGFQFHSVPPGTYTLQAKNAFIGGVPAGMPPEIYPMQQLQATHAFSESSMPVIVKDTDLSGVALSLTEVPMPKTPQQVPPLQMQ